MKQKFAIIGYGNLGKSLEQELKKDADAELRAVYSRRNLDNALYRPLGEINRHSDFDVCLVALGSLSDVEQYAETLAKFNTVDSFDVHARIPRYKERLNKLKRSGISIISAGWDPGLLSLIRGISSVGGGKCSTVWGAGISQGHSNALRSIDGVIDAVQFTVPKDNVEKLVFEGKEGKETHKRVCYVACVEADKRSVHDAIVNMPDYFEGYETEVNFCSAQEVRELKKRTEHKGQVFSFGDGYEWNSQVRLRNNAEYTAKIMLAYAKAIPALLRDGYSGALDPFDIPLKYLADSILI